ERWKSVLNQDYTFAEDALEDIEPLLGLGPKQGQFCDELISELYAEKTNTIYFALPESASNRNCQNCLLLLQV
ncbi:MAG: hypothetical protein IKX92_01460, partial [Clostridia bacterium]|nr:hypothetical protein [Clostridia bacterium]